MIRAILVPLGAAIVAASTLIHAPVAVAAGEGHKVAFHVDENDAQRMNLVLNNAENMTKYYRDKGEEVEIEIVAYGPGLHMLREDTSPIKARVVTFASAHENVAFRSCNVTLGKMTKKEGKAPPLLEFAEPVPSGVVHLVERQEQDWTYIRP